MAQREPRYSCLYRPPRLHSLSSLYMKSANADTDIFQLRDMAVRQEEDLPRYSGFDQHEGKARLAIRWTLSNMISMLQLSPTSSAHRVPKPVMFRTVATHDRTNALNLQYYNFQASEKVE